MDETQNDAPFVAFYNMHDVTFAPSDEKAGERAKSITPASKVFLITS